MAACNRQDYSVLTEDERLHAAVVYGESSSFNNMLEMNAIAFAIANRCRAWGKTITQIRRIQPNYAIAWLGDNPRFNQFMLSSDDCVMKNTGMRMAVEETRKARARIGPDHSNGAMFWDGPDFAKPTHAKRIARFKYGHSSHNIFGVPANPEEQVEYWKIRDPQTGASVKSTKERGRFDSQWISTAAHGKTIFWSVNPAWAKATGGNVYR
jgi:hypothetical protein